MTARTKESTSTERTTLNVAAAAAELGISPDTVVRWIEEGHLLAFVPPGKAIGDARPGPKGYLIFRSDWSAFLRNRTMTGAAPAGPTAQARPPDPTDAAAGTDGVSRRRRAGAGPGA